MHTAWSHSLQNEQKDWSRFQLISLETARVSNKPTQNCLGRDPGEFINNSAYPGVGSRCTKTTTYIQMTTWNGKYSTLKHTSSAHNDRQVTLPARRGHSPGGEKKREKGTEDKFLSRFPSVGGNKQTAKTNKQTTKQRTDKTNNSEN